MARLLSYILLVGAIAMAPATAHSTSHLWRITELFSDATGQVQFIELQESEGDDHETHLHEFGMFLKSLTKSWYFPANLPGPTGNRYVLVATQAFADLPGAPAPDYVLDGSLLPNFFDTNVDAIAFGNELNTFSTVIVSPGMMPLDGVGSLHYAFTGGVPTIGPNSPTNFAGDTGSVGVQQGVPGLSPWALGGLGLLTLVTGFVLRRRHAATI